MYTCVLFHKKKDARVLLNRISQMRGLYTQRYHLGCEVLMFNVLICLCLLLTLQH